jgi:hypothetical protein
MMGGRPVTVVLAVVILGMLALTVLPAQQQKSAAGAAALTTLDYIEVQQLVRKYAWAMDGGDNYGYAYADLFTPDGVFVGRTPDRAEARTYQGRDELAALARGRTLGATRQKLFTMNQVIKPSADGATATGRAYVVALDIGVVGRPNGVNHGGYFDDVYQKTSQGWRFKKRTYVESKVDVRPPAQRQ